MNILIVTAMFPPIRTGTSFYSLNLADAFSKAGHKVTVVTLENRDFRGEKLPYKVHRLRALHFPIKNFFKHFRISSIFPDNYRKILAVAKKEKSEVILLVNHYLDIAFPAIYAARQNHIPLVISVGTQLQSLNPTRNKLLNFFDRLICGGLIFPFSQKIIAWDKEIARYLREIQGKKILKKTVIINYGPNGKKEDFRSFKHDYKEIGQILGVGAVIEQRNFQFTIRVFKKLLDYFPDLQLKIIGHVYFKPTIELVKKLGLKDKITFTGELPHDRVLAELKKSTLYWGTLTGEYVGLGVANLEAMLMGVPLISNAPENLLGKPRLKDMENYIFSDGVTTAEIIPKLVKILKDEQIRRRIGQNGRHFVQKYLNWDLAAKEMVVLFEEAKNIL